MTEIEIALQKLAALQGQVTSDIINDLIEEHRSRRTVMIDLYNRYKADDSTVPVFLRRFEDGTKINNKINNAFDAEIVDTKIGYMFGRPIVYSVDKTEYTDERGEWVDRDAYDGLQDVIDEFCLRNVMSDLDAEAGKMSGICGVAGRLCYIDRDGKERLMNVPPWECIWVYDSSINEAQYAMRYYKVQVYEGGVWQERTRVEWYDDELLTYYISGKEGKYALDEDVVVWNKATGEWVTQNPVRHMFDRIPLIAFPNNEEMQADAEKVLELIDGYDRSLSDVNSEIDQFRLAYMKFIGTTVDADTVKVAQKTGAFGLPEGSDVAFIEKNINDVFIENHLNRLEQNILRFARHVNFGDEAFAGNQSGVALKFKMFSLEAKCITAELKFRRALQQQWVVLCSAWRKKGTTIDPLDIFCDFSRNFPLNILEEAQSTALLKGMVSEPTRLALLPFVDDPGYEQVIMRQEQAEAAAIQREMFGDVDALGRKMGTSPDDGKVKPPEPMTPPK